MSALPSETSIGFHTNLRFKNNSSSAFVFNFIIGKADTFDAISRNENFKVYPFKNYQALTRDNEKERTIHILNGNNMYSFTYRKEYIPQNEDPISEEELAREEAAFTHMLDTFQLIN